jgi:uncharacterized membrane protein
MKEFRLIMQILVMLLISLTMFKDLFVIIVFTIGSVFYFINEYKKEA